MPSTAEWGLITTAAVGVAGIGGTLLAGVLQRNHDRRMVRDERRSGSYVAALKVMDCFHGAAGRNLVPDGSGYNDEGEPSKDELALNSAQLRACGSTAAYEAFRKFERLMWAFYGRHFAADQAAARQRAAGIDDPVALLADRSALAAAFDQLRESIDEFGALVRRDLGADK